MCERKWIVLYAKKQRFSMEDTPENWEYIKKNFYVATQFNTTYATYLTVVGIKKSKGEK